MKLSNKQYIILFLIAISFLLLATVFKQIENLVDNYYIVSSFGKEGFSSLYPIRDVGDGSTTHTVDLPLTTRYSCQNFCGPTARCAKTGQQCFADIDCPGCQPYSPPLPDDNSKCVSPNDDSGKMTYNQTPRYSDLTVDFGSRAKIITYDVNSRPVQANFGVNTWRGKFDKERKLFDKRYKPGQLPYMADYPKTYSFTGEFLEQGPLAANSYL